jgi:hypothetical protein
MTASKGLLATLMSFAAEAAGAAEPTPNDADRRHIESHAGGGDNTEALQLARADKTAFVGKELFFSNGQDVGKIKDIRRWTRDSELYMIVAAKPFFNEDVDYAVPVGDVSRVLKDRVELPESPGMHLRGMQYYPEDFEDVDAGEKVPLIVDE